MNRQDKVNHLINLMDKAIHIWYNSNQRTNWLQLVKGKSGWLGNGVGYRHLRFVNSTTVEVKISSSVCSADKFYQVNFRNEEAYKKMLKDLTNFLDDKHLDISIAHWENTLK